MARSHLVFGTGLLLLGLLCAAAYEVPVLDTDYSHQICSGMWGSQSTYINVSFDSTSQGHLAMVIYEWTDNRYLGKVTSASDDSLPKTYVCTSNAVAGGFCDSEDLGRFILNFPEGMSINDTSFWSARVAFSTKSDPGSSILLRDNTAGNPASSIEKNTSPFRPRHVRALSRDLHGTRQENASTPILNESPSEIYWYHHPIQYHVRKTGYYCVAIVPVTVLEPTHGRAPTDVPFHPPYKGLVFFRNTFDGKLPATDYPKVNFYFFMSLAYIAFAGAWGWMCYKHQHELLPIQYYLSSLVAFLVVEMVANWGYYRYLNAHSKGTAAIVFLIVVAILDAGRNALSFFMLLVVSLGLSVVRESLGRTMTKCQVLAVAHFVFGVIYAVGIVELQFESTSGFVLLLFVIPLAFTLSAFLLWILYSLNGTIAQLRARKQRYKLSMFERLYRILLLAVVVIVIFFVVSSFTFSGRLAEDYAARSWRWRWWLLDGWLALLYLLVFATIAFLWRPSANNRRLAMSDEIAQDEEDAEDYDMEALEGRTRALDDDDATLVGRRGPDTVSQDNVVFEIGDEDAGSDGEDAPTKKRRGERHSLEHNGNAQDEREGLMRHG